MSPVCEPIALRSWDMSRKPFAWSAGIFALGALGALGALASWLLLPSGAPELEPDAPAEMVFAH